MKITREDEMLLEQYGRTASNKFNKLIYGNALLVSLTPIWLFWRIHEMELLSNLIIFAVFTALAAYLISFAYTNSKGQLMERIAIIRTDAITQEVVKEVGSVIKCRKKEADNMIRQKTTDVADYESTTFSIFYINAIFILIALISSTILHQLSDPVNYALSITVASGLTAFLSSAKYQKSHRS